MRLTNHSIIGGASLELSALSAPNRLDLDQTARFFCVRRFPRVLPINDQARRFVRLIRKLRGIGMNDEADRVLAQLSGWPFGPTEPLGRGRRTNIAMAPVPGVPWLTGHPFDTCE